MQFSAVGIRFIVTTSLYSTFINDLKKILFFRKMFIVTEYAALKYSFCSVSSIVLRTAKNSTEFLLFSVQYVKKI